VSHTVTPGLLQRACEQFAILYKSFSFERVMMPG
jgi:hypothetical protein